MFFPIFLFELKYRLRQPTTWIYVGVLLLMGYLLVGLAGGLFSSGVQIGLGGDGQADKINSPFSIGIMVTIISVFGVIIASSLLGNPVYRDVEYRTHELFYTTPITKWGYLGGRFLGSYVGAALGATLPGVEANRFLAHAPASTYLWPYLLLVLPNLFFTGAIFFTLATLTRNILSTYIGAVLLIVGYMISGSYLENLKNEYLVAVADVFGLNAQVLTTRYWTSAEKNTLLLPLSGYLAANRAVWLGVGALLLGSAVGPGQRLPAPLLLVKQRLVADDNQLRFIVATKPGLVAVDPYHELVYRDLTDNKKEVNWLSAW